MNRLHSGAVNLKRVQNMYGDLQLEERFLYDDNEYRQYVWHQASDV
jgi:hypothetical protein